MEGDSAPPGDSACFAREFAALPADRVAVLEAGAQDVDVVGPRQPKGEPVAIRFTEGGEPVGAIQFRFYPGSSLFKIARVLDARCDPVDDYRNVSRGGDKNVLMNYDELQLRAGGRTYQLRLGGSAAGIRANFTRVEP
jgi:hypothetical protein